MTLTVERFAQLAESHGGDIARWPEACREDARAALAAEPQALGPLLAEAAHLDRLLDLAPAGAVNAALLGRLIAAAPAAAVGPRRWIASLGAALGLGVAAVAGVTAGVVLVGHEHETVRADAQIAAAFDPPDLAEILEEPAAL